MAITDFREEFSSRYQDFLRKSLVGLKVANTRFQAGLKSGDVVHRFKLDLSGVVVRDIVNLTDRTIDPITDSDQTLTVDQKKGTTFPIAHWEEVQAGELNPAMTAGKEIAIKVANHLDAVILKETMNGYANFDTGDLTAAGSSGVPFALTSTTVPQMVTMTKAKLETNNIGVTNPCWVLDPVSIGLIAQYPIGKDITSENTF
jgi:hypothetical protein